MQISSRFTIAILILVAIDYFSKEQKITSDFLAGSIQVNPGEVRRILGQLKAADLVQVKRGNGGASLNRPLEDISFYDVYLAVECVEGGTLFHFHENPNPACPVGRNLHSALDQKLESVQEAMEQQLRELSVAEVATDARRMIQKETTGEG